MTIGAQMRACMKFKWTTKPATTRGQTMAVPAGPIEKRYTGNGVSKIYTIPFLLLSATDLDVFIDGEEIVSGFVITNVGNPTSTITFTVAPADQADIFLALNVPFERLNDYQENGDFLSSTVNRDFDRIWQALKQLLRFSARSLTLGFFDVDGSGWYRAKGNGIRDLSDPVEPQDAATKHSVEKLIGDILETGQGPVNSAANVFYVSPSGSIATVQDMSSPDPLLGVSLIFGAGRVVNTISDLTALPARAQAVFVLGYYEPGDGGGGPYAPKPGDVTPVNNGTILSASGGTGRWSLCQSIPPSLIQFGIRAGDTADQTAAIQAVVDAMPGKELRATAGLYRLDGSLEIRLGTRVVMEKGAVFKRITAKTAATVPLLYLLDSFSECRGGKLLTENASPSGCVVLGHKSATDNRNAWWWRFCDMDVEGNGNGLGWVIISGQVTYPMNANYFGTVNNVNTKAFDFGALLYENANAHNIDNVQFWLCKSANIWLRGAYANNFSNMFFHGGAADGCIGIQLVNKVLGTGTQSEQNKFTGFTCETGGPNDRAFVIGDLCTGNVLIGTSNVAGGYTIGNADNNIQLSGYGSASYVSLPGESTKKTGVAPSVATLVTPPGQMSTGESGAYEISVLVYNTANPSLSRLDKLLVASRNSGFAPSPVVNIGSAFTATGVSGEPTSVAYTLDFSGGATAPALSATITSAGGTGSFTVKTRMQRV